MFIDVTDKSGISYTGSSYGSAWRDFNNDGFSDLWLSNHGSNPILYQNQGDGTFIDVTSNVFNQELRGDFHSGAWADFDNDGDLDLLQLVGGDSGNSSLEDPKIANLFFINQNGTFEDRAIDLGLGYIGSRGRTPLWFDYNNDGLLDLLQGAAERTDGKVPATIFYRQDGFVDLQSSLAFDLSATQFALLSDLVGDNTPELILLKPREGIFIYDSTDITDITDSVLETDLQAQDFISEDFNGDLLPDLYLTRRGLSNSGFFLVDNQALNLRLQAQENQQGITFRSQGKITIDLFSFGYSFEEIDPEDIFIGASGLNPTDLDLPLGIVDDTITRLEITLDPQNQQVQGLANFTAGEDEGLYLGYDPDSAEWQISLSTPDKDLVAAIVESEAEITGVDAIAFNNDLNPLSDRLLINDGEMLVDQTQGSGINSVRTAGVSTVAGDFDNDMDVDLYVVTANAAGNEPNVLYDNQGDGTFVAVDDLNDGVGTNLGIGESVSVSDYNNDGFLDLFITNGSFPPILTENAPYQLLENQGNEHHWLEIDLEGTQGNRDGIGAKVYVTAGGVTQLRQQSGGMHNKVQNDSRLHFGLADNTTVENITIEWSSGAVQTLENISADRILEITEDSYF
ncbi:MAG: FG-GAP-like repeat-containing protein [Pleurocapsa sp. MO_226.B13]|nr:FG-GAP-like repeat-containing protein [Pleurocapsa sp. MO_226.B13]